MSLITEIKKIHSYMTPVRLVAVLAGVYLFLITSYFILASLSNGLNMDSYPANGTFQLYNPLRRLLAGEIIGKDFPFFHGVGVPLVHYPLFHILGHNVFAAEVVKWLVSPLVFLVVSSTFFFAFFRKLSHTIIAAAALTIISLIYVDVVWPGNSLLGLRSALPVLVASFMLWRPTLLITVKKRPVSLYLPLLFTLLAVSVACGSEQGLAAIAAYLTIETARIIKSKQLFKKNWWHIPIKLLGIMVAVFIVLSILTAGHASETLHYAFIDVPTEQGWYFGTPPNGYLAWNTFYYLLAPAVLFIGQILLLGLISLVFGVWRKILSKKEMYVISFLIAYGCIVFAASITGYWAPNAQLVPLVRVFSLILVAIGLRFILHFIQKNAHTKKPFTPHKWAALGLFAFLSIALCWNIVITYRIVEPFPVKQVLRQAKDARHAADATYSSAIWKERIAAFEPYIEKGSTIWSTYTSVYDSTNNQLNGSSGGEDYIIHALGKERRESYANDFASQKPDYVITLKPSYFPYEEWLWSRQWEFYKTLLTNYEIVTDNDSHILWRHIDNTKNNQGQTDAKQIIKSKNSSYALNVGTSDRVRLYTVTVNYEIDKKLPLMDKISRYLITISGSSIQRIEIALPAYEKSWEFPVVLGPTDSSVTITPSTEGLGPKLQLKVSSLSYIETPISDKNSFYFYSNRCSFGGSIYLDGGYPNMRCTREQLTFDYFQSVPLLKALSF